MPAFTKKTAAQIKVAEQKENLKPCDHRMTAVEFKRCTEINIARFDRAFDTQKGN